MKIFTRFFEEDDVLDFERQVPNFLFCLLDIDAKDIENRFKKLKKDKDMCPDKVQSYVLSDCSIQLSLPCVSFSRDRSVRIQCQPCGNSQMWYPSSRKEASWELQTGFINID